MLKHFYFAVFMAVALTLGNAIAAEKININTANAEELQMLDGVGPATASAIIEYRKSNSGFESVAELSRVKGIGEKKLQGLSDDVTVSAE